MRAVRSIGSITSIATPSGAGLEMRSLRGANQRDHRRPQIIGKSLVGVVSYLVGVTAAWFSVQAAFIYFVAPLFFIVPPRHD